MENLVTKLNSTVNNSAIPFVDEFCYTVVVPANSWKKIVVYNTTSAFKVRKDPNDDYVISLTSGGQTSDILSLGASSTASFYVSSPTEKEIRIYVTDRKNIVQIGGESASYSSSNFYNTTTGFKSQSSNTMPKLKNINGGYSTNYIIGTLEDVKNMTNVEFLAIKGTTDENINKISDFTNLKNLGIGNNKISGNISSLTALTKLTNFAFGNSGCSGTIESLIQGFRANGRTSGSMTGNSTNNSSVTFNGSTANAKGTVTWTETTITMNGITIDA